MLVATPRIFLSWKMHPWALTSPSRRKVGCDTYPSRIWSRVAFAVKLLQRAWLFPVSWKYPKILPNDDLFLSWKTPQDMVLPHLCPQPFHFYSSLQPYFFHFHFSHFLFLFLFLFSFSWSSISLFWTIIFFPFSWCSLPLTSFLKFWYQGTDVVPDVTTSRFRTCRLYVSVWTD